MAFTSSLPSSSPTPRWAHDVFLSFKGESTYFTDNPYSGLKQKGISTFRVDEKLKQGAINISELLKAIEESRVAIVILLKDYASSKWCLIELAKIVECMENFILLTFLEVSLNYLDWKNFIFVVALVFDHCQNFH